MWVWDFYKGWRWVKRNYFRKRIITALFLGSTAEVLNRFV